MEGALAFAPDIRTLFYLVAAVLLLVSAVYAGLWLQGTGGRASGFWAAGHGTATAGFALLSLRGVAPDFLSITLANPLVVAGALLMMKGLWDLLERPFPDRWAWVGLALVAAAQVHFSHIQPDLGARTVLVTTVGAGILLAGAVTLFRLPPMERGWAHVFTAAAFSGVAAVNLLRAGATLADPAPPELMHAGAIHAAAVMVILLGLVTWTLGFFWLITLRLRREVEREEAEARASERRFRSIFDHSASGIAFGDEAGNIILVNDAFCELVDYSRAELIGQSFVAITHPDDAEREAALVQRMLSEGWSHYRLEKRYLTRAGEAVWVDLIVSVIRDDAGTPLHFVGVAHDISAKKAAQQELEYRATYDPLTGAVNRLQFEHLLEREQGRVDRYQSEATLLMFDVDRFKAVNDTHGHDTGDTVLAGICRLVLDRLREADILGRWGGEEFMVLLPETGAEGGTKLAEEVRAAVAAHHFPGPGTVTISLGVAQLAPGEPLHDLTRRVDTALYAAKDAGRNRVRTISPQGVS
jgi:diguanylate cyclase (GGDEF)-like protein/PAS domain S-box-containing protein